MCGLSLELKLPKATLAVALLYCARQLFDQLYQRRQSLCLIWVRFSGLVHGSPQLDLFDVSAEEERLLQALDHIRRRFGMNAVARAGKRPG